MFKGYYGFSKNPFDKQSVSVKDAFPSKDHKEMTSRLSYLNDIRGIGVFTSAPGFGKTYALRCFAKTLDRNLNEFAYVCLSTVSAMEFYRLLCAALGIDASGRKPAMFRAVQDRLYHLYKEKKKPFLLLIDEAHELSDIILKDLKMIMNHDFDSVNCFTLVLAGEPHLNRTLEKAVHEALRQRIVIHYGFSGLSDAETEQYLLHKLRIAGAAESILGEGTLPAIVSYARGCPRLLDNLMNEALLLGAQLEKPTLDTDTIMAAANNLALA
ncbi:MAG: AAA family ATPase [Oscillospiraceae bacterium]|jgi:type II secretory pathway predicted ATPase ExeA|nr:AAA family ATPase [Oscillospiraceae bacterium]